MSESTPSTPDAKTGKVSPAGISQERHVILEGDELLRELRQGWAGLPNKTLLSLAMGGLRVRMMRSTVTMLSVVLAIAFLTYTGLSSTINYRLVTVAEQLSDQSMTDAAQNAKVKAASERLAAMDLFSAMDSAALKHEASLAGLDRVGNERSELPIAIRNFKRAEDSALDTQNKYDTASKDKKTSPADLNMARSQVDVSVRELAAAQRSVDVLQTKVDMAGWVDSNKLPEGVSEEEMEVRARKLLAQMYRDLLVKINTPGKLDNDNLRLVSRPLVLAGAMEMGEDAALVRDAVGRVRSSRQSAALLNMLRRSGVNIQKTQEGNPMDVWLIVMALMTCAVGIANAMLMSVTERFREIGTMKCLGAQDNLVVKLFLLESAFLGVVGAAGGIVIGVVVSLLASVLQFGSFGLGYFPVVGALPTIFWSVVGGVILSVVGAVYPAYAASRMKPVDALRVDE